MEKYFKNEETFKNELENLISSLNTNNPYSVYNIFCHHINDQTNISPDDVFNQIMDEGLKCNYSTISRTLTYIGTSNSLDIKKLCKYSYVAKNHLKRNVIILAIPKYLKLSPKEIIDFSTPQGSQEGWKQQFYSKLDEIKEQDKPLPVCFTLAGIKVDENENRYFIIDNEKHLGRVKERKRQPIIKGLKERVLSLASRKANNNEDDISLE